MQVNAMQDRQFSITRFKGINFQQAHWCTPR
jgi:hypothetical protein